MSKPKTRATGYYWVKLNPVISDGWEIAHWSAAWRSWQLHGKDNNYKESEGMILEVEETQLTHGSI